MPQPSRPPSRSDSSRSLGPAASQPSAPPTGPTIPLPRSPAGSQPQVARAAGASPSAPASQRGRSAQGTVDARGAYRIGLSAALWAGLMLTVGFAVAGLLLWASSTHQPLEVSQVVALCSRWWMLAHGVPLATWAGGQIQVVPLGITATMGALMVVALVRSVRPVALHLVARPRLVASLMVGSAAGYLAVCASLALLGSDTAWQWLACVIASVVLAVLWAGCACLWVALRHQGAARVGQGEPRGGGALLRALFLGAGAGLLTLLAAGALLVAVGVGVHAQQVQANAEAVQAGMLGTVVMGVVAYSAEGENQAITTALSKVHEMGYPIGTATDFGCLVGAEKLVPNYDPTEHIEARVVAPLFATEADAKRFQQLTGDIIGVAQVKAYCLD